MKEFDVEVRVDACAEHVLVGTQVNRYILSKRLKTEFVNVVTVKPSIAYVMLRLAGVEPGHAVLDPFCGSGTIPLEAAQMTRGVGRFCGCDLVGKSVIGAQQNAISEGLGGCTEFIQGDARASPRLFCADIEADGSSSTSSFTPRFDCVVSNLPWGVFTGKNVDLADLYHGFLHSAWMCVKPGGKVVILILRGLLLLGAIRRMGYWRILDARVVRTANNLPTLFTLERLPADDMRDQLRADLSSHAKHMDLGGKLFSMVRDEGDFHLQKKEEGSATEGGVGKAERKARNQEERKAAKGRPSVR
jgi:SAM-dependent methyltransferase